MALFGGFVDFMAQDMVFWLLVGGCCLFVILATILILVLILKLSQKSTNGTRYPHRHSRDREAE